MTDLNRQALNALNDAALAIAGELTLDRVLQLIVDVTRELVNAQYAALGVPNGMGWLDAFIYSGMAPELVDKMPHLPQGHGLLGAIIKEKKPIRIPDLTADSRSYGFPENHPPMDNFLGVPVRAGKEILGNLYLTNKLDGDTFTEEDEYLVQMFAAHAAVAIQNARLYEEVERLAILEERTRIGMDLHDGVIQSIYAVGLTLESARMTLPDEAADTQQLIQSAVEQLNGSIQDIRNFIMDLRPRRFRGDLRQGLIQLCREFQANTMIAVSLDIGEFAGHNIGALPVPTARSFFLTTQEALANIARHANATQVYVRLNLVQKEMPMLQLIIEDNGTGFDTKNQSSRIGHGLANMHTRAKERGGRCVIKSEPGIGTTITLIIPMK